MTYGSEDGARSDATIQGSASEREDGFNIVIAPSRVLLVIAISTCALVTLGTLFSWLAYQKKILTTLAKVFLLDRERNVPTFFSFSLLLSSSVLLVLIAAREWRRRGRWRVHWLGLAVIFLFLAFDEAALVHERFIRPIRNALDTGGVLYFAWVIPAAAAMILLAIVYFPLVLALESPFRALFIAAGCLYVGGAMGAEMIGAMYADEKGMRSFSYQLITIVEEALEMTGAGIFTYALTRFLLDQPGPVVLRISGR